MIYKHYIAYHWVYNQNNHLLIIIIKISYLYIALFKVPKALYIEGVPR